MNEKKKINIKSVGFEGISGNWAEEDNWFVKILSQRYEVVRSDTPDFIICGIFGGYPHTNYDCPRIMYCTENIAPDFTVVDYAISNDKIEFGDRHFYYPMPVHNYNYPAEGKAEVLAKRKIDPSDKEILKGKDIFCNFIFRHGGENQVREKFFKELSEKYKPVTSAGMYMNNMPDGKGVTDKIAFQEKCKFSIAFENTTYPGCCSEKLTDAFYAKTIPIYYGDPLAKNIYNPRAYINLEDYKDWDEVIEVIRRLDNDDEAYMKMLAEPVFIDCGFPARRQKELLEWLYHIFDQNPADAYRRSRYLYSMSHNDRLSELHNLVRVIKKHKTGKHLYKALSIYCADGVSGLLRRLRQKEKGSA